MERLDAFVIHGVNLNLLGKREPNIYGRWTLDDLNNMILNKAKEYHFSIKIFQSNYEGEIVELIHKFGEHSDYLIINPGAYTHTSIAIRDAILGIGIKTIEVHISNVYKREEFRHKSYISPVAVGVISGFGVYGYIMALDYIRYERLYKR